MRKTYKIKLYRNKKNKHLNDTINLAGRAWNHAIALYKRYYALTGKHLNQYDLMRHFAKLKKLPKWSWLKEIPSQALQDVIERIEKGYQLFFKSAKGEIGFKVFPPSFRKVVKYKSFTLKVAGWGWAGPRKLRIGKRTYKLVNDRMPQGDIKTVTIKRDPLGDLWACFSVDQDILLPVPTPGNIAGNAIIGVDFGLKTFLTIHDGSITYSIEAPLFFKQSMSRLKKLNRAL